MEFSQPVAYNTMNIEDIISVSVSGPEAPYNFSYAVPFWEKN
jgi:hypothetical protein